MASTLAAFSLAARGLVVKALAVRNVPAGLLQLRGRAGGQALAVGRAIVQHREGLGLQLRSEGADGLGLQRVVGHQAEGGAMAQLGVLGVGGNRQLGDVLGGIDRRGLDAHAGVQVADDSHHAGIHQLLRHLLAGLGVGAVVHRHHFQRDRLALDLEAGLVQLVHGQAHAVVHVLPQGGQVAGHGLGHADLHHAGGVVAAGQQQGRGSETQGQDACGGLPPGALLHGDLQVGLSATKCMRRSRPNPPGFH
jgi:hypothetical protein